MHDPTDPRKPPRRQEQARSIPPGWQPYPPGVNPSMGVPRDDRRLWWRLQPGQRGGGGGWVRRGIVHGGTCARWPTGRAPAGWLWAIWPRQGTGPRDWPTAEA
jgi:hypothetical protein